MKQKIIKGISVLLTLAVAIAFLVNNIQNNEDNIVYAREVFSQVKDIGKSTAADKPFTILEIVDEKSAFDKTNGGTYKVGEEELAYMVGGTEPFREALEEIITAANGDLNPGTVDFHEENKRTQYEEQFNAIVEALSGRGLIDKDSKIAPGDVDGSDYPLSQITGLDRYGTTIYRSSAADRTIYDNNKIKDGNEIQASSLEELRNILFGPDGLQGYSRDIAFKVNSNQTAMYGNTQGFSYASVVGSGKVTNYPNLYYYRISFSFRRNY